MNLIVCNFGFPKGKWHMYSLWKCISMHSKNNFISYLHSTTNFPRWGCTCIGTNGMWSAIQAYLPSMWILMLQWWQDSILTPLAWHSSSSTLRINVNLCTWFSSIWQFGQWFWLVRSLIAIRFVFMVPHRGYGLGWGRKRTLVVAWSGSTLVS